MVLTTQKWYKYITNPALTASATLEPFANWIGSSLNSVKSWQSARIHFRNLLGPYAYNSGRVYYSSKYGYQWISRSGNIIVNQKGERFVKR